MKYTPKQFALAYVSAIQGADVKERELVIKRAAKILKDTGGARKIKAITEAIEEVWQDKTGAHKYSVVSALPLESSVQKQLSEKLKSKDGDIFEYSMGPALVAGLIIKENRDRVLDMSFTNRVTKLFS